MLDNKLAQEMVHGIISPCHRISKKEYFMGVAKAVALRATCPRRSVGCILVIDGQIVSSGYNGSPRGLPHCIDSGCEMDQGHCVRSVHGEANCLLQAAHHGISTKGSTLYTTASPCRACMSLIINAGVHSVVYAEAYSSSDHEELEDASLWALRAAKATGILMTLIE